MPRTHGISKMHVENTHLPCLGERLLRSHKQAIRVFLWVFVLFVFVLCECSSCWLHQTTVVFSHISCNEQKSRWLCTGLCAPLFSLVEQKRGGELALGFLEKELCINYMFANRANILHIFLSMNKINY